MLIPLTDPDNRGLHRVAADGARLSLNSVQTESDRLHATRPLGDDCILSSARHLCETDPIVSVEEGPLIRRQMPELDTIRGLAVMGVLLYHGLYWRQDLTQFPRLERLFLTGMWTGRLGVDLFFVLSGFLITGILTDSRSNANYYKRFYVRRALRILPAYLVIITILFAFRYAPPSFIVLSLLYLSNLTPLFGISVAYPVLWSLAVEEHFYFLWPMAVKNLRNQQLIIACFAVIVLTPISRLFSFYLSDKHALDSFVFNDYTWNAMDGLACGAMLSLLLRGYDLKRSQLLKLSLGLFGLSIAIWLLGVPYGILTRQTAVGAALQVVPWHFVFAGTVGIFLLIGTGRWRNIVQNAVLRFLGEISYGLYLSHLLVFDLFDHLSTRYWKQQNAFAPFSWLLIRMTIAGSVAILVAYLSRQYFEAWFLRLKDRLS